MSTPFGTSLRRDPTDPRGLKERIDALLRERLEDAIDTACLDLLVELRRARRLPMPASGSPEDRAEFDALVGAFLGRLEASLAAELADEERSRLAAGPAAAGDETRRLIAVQVALSRHLPDYWQRFEAVKAALVLEQTQAAAVRPGLLGRLLGRG